VIHGETLQLHTYTALKNTKIPDEETVHHTQNKFMHQAAAPLPKTRVNVDEKCLKNDRVVVVNVASKMCCDTGNVYEAEAALPFQFGLIAPSTSNPTTAV